MSLSDHFARDPETGCATICEAEWLQGPDREPAMSPREIATTLAVLALLAGAGWLAIVCLF